jgi:glutamyl-tRNA reductase
MDDLQQLVERNTSGRETEALHAESILAAEQRRFETWLASQEVTPTVAGLRRRAEEIVERTLAENADRWEGMTPADEERLRKMASAIASRLLHEPTLRVKQAAAEEGSAMYVHALRELFGLDAGSEPIDAEAAGAEVTELDARRRGRRS